MYYTKEITGHGWCIFDYKTCIMLYEGMTWEEVLEFARKNNLNLRGRIICPIENTTERMTR